MELISAELANLQPTNIFLLIFNKTLQNLIHKQVSFVQKINKYRKKQKLCTKYKLKPDYRFGAIKGGISSVQKR